MKTQSQRLDKAVGKILEAQTIILDLALEAKANKEHGFAGSMDHFFIELNTILESDNGEAGLVALCTKLRAKE